jgi:hypothetical protein
MIVKVLGASFEIIAVMLFQRPKTVRDEAIHRLWRPSIKKDIFHANLSS